MVASRCSARRSRERGSRRPERFDYLQGFLDMTARLSLRVEHVPDDPVPIDDVGNAPRNEPQEGTRHSIRLSKAPTGITHQREWQAMLGCERAVRIHGIAADPHHRRSGGLKIFIGVAKGA